MHVRQPHLLIPSNFFTRPTQIKFPECKHSHMDGKFLLPFYFALITVEFCLPFFWRGRDSCAHYLTTKIDIPQIQKKWPHPRRRRPKHLMAFFLPLVRKLSPPPLSLQKPGSTPGIHVMDLNDINSIANNCKRCNLRLSKVLLARSKF